MAFYDDGGFIMFIIGMILIVAAVLVWMFTARVDWWFWILLIIGGIMVIVGLLWMLYATYEVPAVVAPVAPVAPGVAATPYNSPNVVYHSVPSQAPSYGVVDQPTHVAVGTHQPTHVAVGAHSPTHVAVGAHSPTHVAVNQHGVATHYVTAVQGTHTMTSNNPVTGAHTVSSSTPSGDMHHTTVANPVSSHTVVQHQPATQTVINQPVTPRPQVQTTRTSQPVRTVQFAPMTMQNV